ncbi:hypothetical protein PV327_002019 [Microctonus hyperodae]|uniref:Uncharacterized protein n=1 Tax=Microctonus hyperodae TaxID=165561 RepID=A0AA39FEP8_MICHY|nr:hypothetical protein PV327_002019 [Microctonus hyperodae]
MTSNENPAGVKELPQERGHDSSCESLNVDKLLRIGKIDSNKDDESIQSQCQSVKTSLECLAQEVELMVKFAEDDDDWVNNKEYLKLQFEELLTKKKKARESAVVIRPEFKDHEMHDHLFDEWLKQGELSIASKPSEERVEKIMPVAKSDVLPSTSKEVADSSQSSQGWNPEVEEALRRQKEMKNFRPSLASVKKADSHVEVVPDKKSEVTKLLEGISNMPPPRIKLTLPTRITSEQIQAESQKRGRLRNLFREKQFSTVLGRKLHSTDDPKAVVAPSVTIEPLPLAKIPEFEEVLKELGIIDSNGQLKESTSFILDWRVLSKEALKRLIITRARFLLEKLDVNKVDRSTQTYVTHVGKRFVAGCVNCRSGIHDLQDCKLPLRPGFCHVCGADGFDTDDCIYPHGIEHERILGRCAGCSRDSSLYCPECPECPDCNLRFEGLVDWLRLNYATWPEWMVPKDHRYLINPEEQVLRRRVKAKFDDPTDNANLIRAFLIRENGLKEAASLTNAHSKTALKLSEEKRQRAVKALLHPYVKKALDEILSERPELSAGEEIKIIVPTKYKKPTK